MPRSFESACKANNCQKVSEHITNNNIPLDVNVINKASKTGLIIASQHNSLDVAKLLISKGADINAVDNEGFNALHHAIVEVKSNVAKVLIDEGIDLNLTCRETKESVLHLAAEKGLYEVVEMIVKRDESMKDWQNTDGFNALQLACMKGHSNVVAILTKESRDVSVYYIKSKDNILHLAARMCPTSEVPRDDRGFEMPKRFNGKSNAIVVKLLLQKCPQFRVLQTNGNYKTPLHEACMVGDLEVVKLLVAHSAEVVNATTKKGDTPLHIAARHQYPKIVEHLLENKAVVDKTTYTGYSPLHEASISGVMVRFLRNV